MKDKVLPCLAYFLLAILLTHPLWLHLSEAVPSDIGDPLLNAWIMAWDIHALLKDPAHLFDANIFYPLKNTLAYSEHLLGTALLTGPFYLAFGEPVLAYNMAFILSFALGGFGMYLLALRLLKNRAAAFLAGLAFAFAPYRLAAFSHIQLLTSQWIPFALLFLDDFLRLQVRRASEDAWHLRALGLFCFFLLFQAASSWHLAVFTLFIMVVYTGGWWLNCLALRKCQALLCWPVLGWLALAGLVVCAALFPLALPYLKVMGELKVARRPEVLISFSARPGDFLAAAPHNQLFGKILTQFSARPGFTEENFLFPGLVAPLLALASLFPLPGCRKVRNVRRTLSLWVTTLGALIFTFGPVWPFSLPYSLLTSILPFADLIRVPPRWAVAMLFPLSLLAGYGYLRLLSFFRREHYLFPLLALGLMAESFSLPLPLAKVGSTADLPLCYRWLAQEEEDFAILEIPFYSPPELEYPESKRLYASTIHWKALVNGYSGLTPARQEGLGRALAGFPDESALSIIRELAPRYVIVHSLEEGFNRVAWEEEGRWRLARSLDLRLVHLSEGNYVYEFNPYGQALLTAPAEIIDPYWQGRIPCLLRADFGGLISLLGYEVNTGAYGPALTLYWQAQKKLERDYTVFVHLLDEKEAIIAQGDSPPVAGHYPTSLWQPGEIVRDEHPINLAGSLEKGLHFRVGLYRPEIPGQEGRLPVLNAAGEKVGTYVDLPGFSW